MKTPSERTHDLEKRLREDATQFAAEEPALGFHRRMAGAVVASTRRLARQALIARWAVSLAGSFAVGALLWKQSIQPTPSVEGTQVKGSVEAGRFAPKDPRSLGRLRVGLAGDAFQTFGQHPGTSGPGAGVEGRLIRNRPRDRLAILSELLE